MAPPPTEPTTSVAAAQTTSKLGNHRQSPPLLLGETSRKRNLDTNGTTSANTKTSSKSSKSSKCTKTNCTSSTKTSSVPEEYVCYNTNNNLYNANNHRKDVSSYVHPKKSSKEYRAYYEAAQAAAAAVASEFFTKQQPKCQADRYFPVAAAGQVATGSSPPPFSPYNHLASLTTLEYPGSAASASRLICGSSHQYAATTRAQLTYAHQHSAAYYNNNANNQQPFDPFIDLHAANWPNRRLKDDPNDRIIERITTPTHHQSSDHQQAKPRTGSNLVLDQEQATPSSNTVRAASFTTLVASVDNCSSLVSEQQHEHANHRTNFGTSTARPTSTLKSDRVSSDIKCSSYSDHLGSSKGKSSNYSNRKMTVVHRVLSPSIASSQYQNKNGSPASIIITASRNSPTNNSCTPISSSSSSGSSSGSSYLSSTQSSSLECSYHQQHRQNINCSSFSFGPYEPTTSNPSTSTPTSNNCRSASGSGSKPKSKPRRRVATVAQRRAANIRERRRMFNLNSAFDKLRKKVPTFAYEKRLSRIETLRLAIMYISFMSDLLETNSSSIPASSNTSDILIRKSNTNSDSEDFDSKKSISPIPLAMANNNENLMPATHLTTTTGTPTRTSTPISLATSPAIAPIVFGGTASPASSMVQQYQPENLYHYHYGNAYEHHHHRYQTHAAATAVFWNGNQSISCTDHYTTPSSAELFHSNRY